MAQTPISFLLMKRITQNPKPAFSNLFHLSRYLSLKPYSTSSLPDPPKPSSLSARMSFVFDQIDAIERERAQKDETLQRIRAWRQSKNTVQHQLQNPQTISSENPEILSSQNEGLESRFADNGDSSLKLTDINSVELKKKTEVEVVHPWPEWIELMERLVQQNYFDHRRKDEDKMVRDLGFDEHGIGSDDDFGIDFKDFKTVQTACVNFGKDRFDIFRSLSRKDIQVLVGYGCPSADKKVVFSAKLLRKHVHLDEGDVCSNCSLRSSCERAYLITNKEDEARTIDVMRVLLTYGFDPINGSVVNKSLLKQKSIRAVVRKLLHEVVKLSAVPIDPNLPPPVIKKPPPKVKQPPPTPKRRVGRDDVEMKKGDWLCPKCDFMNFAKNTVCLQCDAKRPKRQLLPGEWECPECNFLNYRRNMACFHCDCKRPPDEFIENKMEEKQHGHKTRLEKVTSRPEVSNAWNFDFDDNESDGADVAAFEYADPEAMNEDSPLGARAQGGNFRVLDEDLNRTSRIPRVHEREFSDSSHNRPGMGFDDFDDEDDVDSYELDTENNSPAWKDSRNNLSRTEISESEDVEDFDDNFSRPRKSPSSYNKPSKPMHKKAAFSGFEDDELDIDSDEELSVHPKWKSSHVADARHKNRGRGPTGPSRGLTFGSDEEIELDSDVDDDFGSSKRRGNKQGLSRRNHQRSSDRKDVSFSASESENDELSSRGKQYGRNNMEAGERRGNFRGRGDHDFASDPKGRSKGKMGDRRNSWNDDFDRSSRGHGSRDKSRGFQGNDHLGRRNYQRSSDGKYVSFSASESENDGSRGKQYGRNNMEAGGRRGNIRGRGDHDFASDPKGRSKGKLGDRRNSWSDDFDRSSRGHGSRDKSRGFRGNDHSDRRQNNGGGNFRDFKGPKQGRSRDYNMDMDRDFGEFRNSRRVIER